MSNNGRFQVESGAVAVAENKEYSAAVAATSDIVQDGGGIKTIDFKCYLADNGFVSEPVERGTTLESLWHSDLIGVSDAGIIMLSDAADGRENHAVGFRAGKMMVHDQISAVQTYSSAEIIGVYLRKSNDEAAIKRTVKRQVSQTPVSFSEQTPMTLEDLEKLEACQRNSGKYRFSTWH